MSERRPIIAGNWKMNKTHLDALSLVRTLSYELESDDYERVEIVICPPFTALRSVQLVVEEEHFPMKLGAQNMHHEANGAFTGEISGPMLQSLHVSYVIVGHSERRQLFGETDETVNAKAHAAFREGLIPIVCVGETLEEREGGHTQTVLARQLREGLKGLSKEQASKVVVAYEPVWAIGTGRAASPEDANESIGFIRGIASEFGDAEQVRIQYGGSVTEGNIGSFMAQDHVDGALVGGASLDPRKFAMIIKYR